jgi:hypothetical protein
MKILLVAFMLLGVPMGAMAQAVVPSFTRGTVDSSTTTKTKVTESVRQIDYTTGTSYTVTGTNINIPENPKPGANYTIQTQGAPFQFSETIMSPGVAKETWIERTTEQDSYTKSLSVFTQ